MLMIVLKI